MADLLQGMELLVPSYPTDLNAEEKELAQIRLQEMAEKFTADGTLCTPAWREVFQRTWRHPYVPSYYPELDAPCLLCIDPARRAEWLATVYSDGTLVTKIVQLPMIRELWPATYPSWDQLLHAAISGADYARSTRRCQ